MLIERVARAMYEAHNGPIHPGGPIPNWDRCHERVKKAYRRYAATAIRILQEMPAGSES